MGTREKAPLVSVVVPVYNVERFLPHCLESIARQTYRRIEVVLVDDGSTDESGRICDEQAASDGRFRTIHRENGGLSAARNTGLGAARGDFVTFVDADDVLTRDYVKVLVEPLRKGRADCSLCCFDRFEDDGELGSLKRSKPASEADCILSGDRATAALFLEERWGLCFSAYAKMFRRGDLERFPALFPVGKVHEDLYVMHECVYPCSRVYVSRRTCYHYRLRAGSITLSGFSMRRFDELEAIAAQVAYYRERGDVVLERLAVISSLLRCMVIWGQAVGNDFEAEAQERAYRLFGEWYQEGHARGYGYGSYEMMFASFLRRPMKWYVFTAFLGVEDDHDDPVVAFCARLFTQALCRDYREEDLAAQVRGIRTGMGASEVAINIFCCYEFEMKGMSNAEVVERAYLTMLNRLSDEEGFAFWTAKMDAGMTVRELISGFAESDEFRAWCAEVGIRP